MLTTLPNRVSALLADPFHTAMRDLTDDFRWSAGEYDNSQGRMAPLSIWEDSEAFYVDADVPGVALDDLDVSLERGKLTIRGEKKQKSAPGANAQYNERSYGRFERTISVNEWVDPSNIEASLSDGVLHLKLAKKPESQCHQVKITRSTDSLQRIDSTPES